MQQMAKKNPGKKTPKVETPSKKDRGKGRQWDNFNKSLEKVIGKVDGSILA